MAQEVLARAEGASAGGASAVRRGGPSVLLGFWLGVALCVAWLASQTAVFASAHEGRILPGAKISGVELGGKTEQAALEAVRAVVAPQLDRTIRLVHHDRTWETTPRQLGATSD